jgi:osmoprotectant transport system ATP-binding protein
VSHPAGVHPPRLAARDVVHYYGGQTSATAIDHATLLVGAGHATAVVGESGSGKTTLLRCFNRMVEPVSGTIEVGDSDVRDLPAVSLRRRIGYVPQDGGLLPHWRVLRNVALVPTLLRLPDPERAASDALALVGLDVATFGRRFPHELSGGQRQRVALARALAARPGVLLLDEPFGAVDAITRADLQETFVDLRRELAVTTLLVTHDLAEAMRLADQIAVMHRGRVEQCADAETLFTAPATEYVAELFARALATSMHVPHA